MACMFVAVARFTDPLEAHIACGRLTIADFQLASMACEWREAGMPFGDYPHIVRWLDRLQAIPAWAQPWPSQAMPAAAHA